MKRNNKNNMVGKLKIIKNLDNARRKLEKNKESLNIIEKESLKDYINWLENVVVILTNEVYDERNK